MEKYKKRILDDKIEKLVGMMPAIAIDGAKAVGKTRTACRIAASTFEFDKPETQTLYNINPKMIVESNTPILLDEWQRVPEIWDTVRRLVDKDNTPAQYILTGSAYPKDANIHSGAGRIIHQKLYPLSLQEKFNAKEVVSIRDCFDGAVKDEFIFETKISFEDYIREITRSGFPGIYFSKEESIPYYIETYIENIISVEMLENNYKIRKPDSMKRWLRSFAAATGTESGYNEILDNATAGERDKPSKATTNTYREILQNLWLLEELPAWLPLEGNFNRLKATPKHYLADPALEAMLLKITFDEMASMKATSKFDEKYGSIVGRLFESLVALSLRTYSSANDAGLSYLKTRNGDHEIDFILSKGKKIIAVEVKLSNDVVDSDVKHLNWLQGQIGGNLSQKIIINTGKYAYRRKEDGVIVCPAALLGA
ncbi:ATPase AAA [Clostridia bacterium]|nr:ATPase AAA [Clostridia bacterium]